MNTPQNPQLHKHIVMRPSFWFMKDNHLFCKPKGNNIEEIKTDMLTTVSIKEKIDNYEIRNIYFVDNIEPKYEGVKWNKYILISKFVFKSVSYGKIRTEYCSSTINRNIFNIMNEIDAMDKKEFDWIFINNEDNVVE